MASSTSCDAELIVLVRSGDLEAYGALFERHREAALRLARHLVGGPDSDDLVADAFSRVLSTIQNGKGPDEFFRAYLLTSLRRLHVDRVRALQKVRPTGDEAELDRAVAWVDPAEMRFEAGAAAQAFSSLPERWQLVLWHLDVEGQKPGAIAPLLGMSANSVSALAYRAREGLRQAFLQEHLAANQRIECRDFTPKLGAYVRGSLSSRDRARVDAHLDTCARCTGLVMELTEVNQNLAGILAPAVLGTAAAGYLGAGAASTGALAAVLSPVQTIRSSGPQGAAVGAALVALVAAGAYGAIGGFGSNDPAAVAAPTAVQEPAPTAPTQPPADPGPTLAPPTVKPQAAPRPAPTLPAPIVAAPQTVAEALGRDYPQTSSGPTRPGTTPTDYALDSVDIANQAPPQQRSITAVISAANSGKAGPQAVDVSFAFARAVTFRGEVTEGWSCGDVADGDRVTVVICRTTLPASSGSSVGFSVAGTTPHGSVNVSSTGDPVESNDTRQFSAPVWTAP